MATHTYISNNHDGRYLKLTVTEEVNVIGNYSVLSWTLESTGGSLKYYSVAPTTVKINGIQVYSNGTMLAATKKFPVAEGSVSGTVKVVHNSDGTKTGVPIVFDTHVYITTTQSYGGSIDLTEIDRRAPTVSLSVSGITASSAVIEATSTEITDIWEYSIDGGLSWREVSSDKEKTVLKIVTGLLPNTTYKIKVRARRKDNQVYGTSSVREIKTLGNTLLNSVNALTVDAANPALTMNWTVYASFTHTLVIKDDGKTVLTITGLTCSKGTNNITVSLTSEQREKILEHMASKKSFTAKFCLTTYNGSTRIGDTVSKDATIQTTSGTSAPSFSDFTHRDSNKYGTVDITGDNQIYIKGYSSLQIEIGEPSPKNEASISSYKVTVGSVSKSFNETTIDYGTIDTSGNVTLKVEVIDSRGYTTAVTKNITVIDYQDISITDYTIRRKNEVEPTVQLAFSGNISPITIDGTARNRAVSAKFRYAQSGKGFSDWESLTVGTTYPSFEFATLALSGFDGVIAFDSNLQYTIEIQVADSLSSDTITLTVNKGTPLVAYRSKKVGINTPNPQAALDVVGGFILDGEPLADFVVEQGTKDIWTYRKWSSGIAECFGRAYVETEFTNTWGQNCVSNERTPLKEYPFKFIERPIETAQLTFDNFAVWTCLDAGCLNTAEHCGQYKGIRGKETPHVAKMYIDFQVKGKWK